MTIVFIVGGIKIIEENYLESQHRNSSKDSIILPPKTTPKAREFAPIKKALFEDKAIYLFILGMSSGLIALAGMLTYREKFYRFDQKRWNCKGLKPKLEVIGDWIVN
jgi:hypothetical protein